MSVDHLIAGMAGFALAALAGVAIFALVTGRQIVRAGAETRRQIAAERTRLGALVEVARDARRRT